MTATGEPAHGPALLERATGYTRGCLALVAGVAPDSPTPCHAWDLAALLAHMRDSLDALCEAADVGVVALDAGGPAGDRAAGAAGDDPVEALRVRACHLLAGWSRRDHPDRVDVGGAPLASDLLAVTGALEVAVHGWDVAAACGRPRPLPDGLAAALLLRAPLLVDPDDRPGRFAPALPLPPGASPGDRLLALLGRRPP
jgi:uncharacterized protein (TIGR03086 family)